MHLFLQEQAVHPPKLIIIEGIPGSGKTSTAQNAADWLRGQGREARLFLEGDVNHPADFESVACLEADAFRDLLGRFPDQQTGLAAQAQAGPDGRVLIRFGRLDNPPEALRSILSAQDVYNLPEADFMAVTLARWQDFAAAAAREEAVYVFECCLLQNQLTTLMAVHDTPPERSQTQMAQIGRAIAPLNPLVIYLEPPSLRAALERVAGERPAAWLAFVTAYTAGQAWGQHRGLSGKAGMIAFYEARRDLEKEIFAGLFPGGLWIEQAGADWGATTARVQECLAGAFGRGNSL